VTPKEQEIAIGELEERVDRLRVLYDQYFLGFEKLEPTVPRKDVERRFAILRKEQIRNTALRFRFNVVTQKYNTYGMYWLRICRQIEEGTYKRHVRRAKARFGDGRDRDISIDVDLADFEMDLDAEMDMDAVLAEANAAAEAFSRDDDGDNADTVPPPPLAGGGRRADPLAEQRMVLATPGTSFVVGGRREKLDEPEPRTPIPPSAGPSSERIARPAPLPAGSKPRIVRRVSRTDEGEVAPPSQPRIAMPGQPAPSQPRVAGPGQPAPSQPRVAGPGQPAPSQPRVAGPGQPAPAGSAGRIPVAAPPPSGRLPAAPPPSGRLPAASPPSGARIPVGPPQSSRTPGAPQGAPSHGGAASAGRVPVAAPSAPGPRPAIGRIAGPPPPGRPGAPSAGRVPAAAPAPSSPGSAGRPAPGGARPPAPSVPDDKASSPPGVPGRPRARVPLPSESGRPPKKD